MRGATRRNRKEVYPDSISTHTPLTKRDDFKLHIAVPCQVSTHTPHARRDSITFDGEWMPKISTPTPLSRRDDWQRRDWAHSWHFYSHASCEARPPHSLDLSSAFPFLLPRLLRGATTKHNLSAKRLRISTHAPLARRDMPALFCIQSYMDFYSRASYEARQLRRQRSKSAKQFLLTRLMRGATTKYHKLAVAPVISTPTPLARRDLYCFDNKDGGTNFYSHAS